MELPTTHWTLLAQASLHGDRSASKALEDFCRRYRAPIVAMIRRRGVLDERVEDVAHDFIVQLMTHSALKRVDPAKGRFRQFLAGALSRFLADDVKKNQAQKRGGDAQHLSLDADDGLAERLDASDESADRLLDREWALQVVANALHSLAEEWRRTGKEARFEVLRLFLPGAPTVISQAEAAGRLALSEVALRSDLSRLRTAFRAAVRMEVAATVGSASEVEEEMNHLMRVLQSPQIEFLPQSRGNS